MILSVSRRTDIPNYYSEWFYNRVREGFLYVRNPLNPRQISRIPISPDVVDCIVFWTKNPAAMLPGLGQLEDYKYYFQFTITGYGCDMEPNLPDKRNQVIRTFRQLSEWLGPNRVIWRYDPILLNERYTIDYHIRAFREIACQLNGYTGKVVISFIDAYTKIKRQMRENRIRELCQEEMLYLAAAMAETAALYQMKIETCAEHIDLSRIGIRHGSCIDKSVIETITGYRIKAAKDRNQRPECGCIESMDAGSYDTCMNGCLYCYANSSSTGVAAAVSRYDANSPLLCGVIGEEDRITERKVTLLRENQISLFD